jgi:hypothetical protein
MALRLIWLSCGRAEADGLVDVRRLGQARSMECAAGYTRDVAVVGAQARTFCTGWYLLIYINAVRVDAKKHVDRVPGAEGDSSGRMSQGMVASSGRNVLHSSHARARDPA